LSRNFSFSWLESSKGKIKIHIYIYIYIYMYAPYPLCAFLVLLHTNSCLQILRLLKQNIRAVG
jgi:hypothetical protein